MTRPPYRNYSAIEADLPALLELALSVLYHGETCEFVFLDRVTGLSTNELSLLRDRLESFMQADLSAGSTGSPLARALACLPDGYQPRMDEDGYISPGNRALLARANARYLAYANGVVDFEAAAKAAEEAFYPD